LKVLFVGYGSIARKHHAALLRINPDAEVFALRSNNPSESIEGVTNVYEDDYRSYSYDFVIISNPTSKHFDAIYKMASLGKPLFIEKPPLHSIEQADELIKHVQDSGVKTYTAFNLRFHPVIEWLKANISGQDVLEFTAYCGSYLPEWRPGTDYRKSYSAIPELGGGVHLDLIHELDYITWLFGTPNFTTGVAGKYSSLEMSSYDSAHYLLTYPHCCGTISLNYFRRDPQRTFEIVTHEGSLRADLIQHQVIKSNGELVFSASIDLIGVYERQLRYFIQAVKNNSTLMNSLPESIETLKMCLNLNHHEQTKG
jgi:predicted dehydrogenase